MSKSQIQAECGNERADAGREGQLRLARPNPQGYKRGQGKIHFSVQLATSRTGNQARLIHTPLTERALDWGSLSYVYYRPSS